MTNNKIPVGIIGAGISGLSIAYSLQQKGIKATVYEKAQEVGGSIQSIRRNSWLIEEGPNSLMVKSQAVWDLLDKLGLADDIVEANPAARKRYVVKDKMPHALPNSAVSFLKTSLFSTRAKLRLLKEPFVPPSTQHDESIAAFVERRLGCEPLDYAVNPFVSGIFAGDPKKLSIKHTFSSLWEMEQQHGSLLKGMIKKGRSSSSGKRALISFRQGNQMLPKALAAGLAVPVQTATDITSARKKGNRWHVRGESKGEAIAAEHQCLVSTVPARSVPSIFEKDTFAELGTLPYAPLKVMAMGFKEEQISHPLDGFGMLIPEAEGFKTLGVLFSSTLFAGRSAEGHQLLTCFIGGARNPQWARKSTEEVKSKILDELKTLLGIEGSPIFLHHHFWPEAIPQYEVGYDFYLSLMKDIEQEHKGLYLEGNYRNGVSVPDCISSGFETAHKVHTYLRSKND